MNLKCLCLDKQVIYIDKNLSEIPNLIHFIDIISIDKNLSVCGILSLIHFNTYFFY